jgi:HPt (histidine-containing phosphotransfer) domain-containing protein
VTPYLSGHLPDPSPVENDGRMTLARSVALLAHRVEEIGESVCRHAGEVRGAVRSGNAEALTSSAHHLRHSCDLIGAKRMATLAARLEVMGKEARVQEVRPRLMTEFESEYRAVCRLLDVALLAARTAAAMGHPRVA